MGFRNPAIWIILILLVILLFGASKLPDITRNIGKSLKIFKEEVRDLSDDRTDQSIDHNPSPPPQQTPPPQASPSPENTNGESPPHAPKPPTDPR